MKLKYFQVDAFTKQMFKGNPAGVCLLDHWFSDDILQKIAFENNLSETAFIVKISSGYELRWFTPIKEIELCGHATLASAWVIFNHIDSTLSKIYFSTKSGTLIVIRQNNSLEMDFPSRKINQVDPPKSLVKGLGMTPLETYLSVDYMAVFDTELDVRNISPNMQLLENLDCVGIIVTAPGNDSDFVSRFFAPRYGVNEDPVTGSAHCLLTPYWSKHLGKTTLHAKQISARGGELTCKNRNDRITLTGECVTFLEGTINFDLSI